MLTAQGKYGEAIIYTDNIEQEAYGQIVKMMNVDMFENEQVRIMPDVHAGKGSVVGFTSTFTEKVCPNIVGVDIGCGILTIKFKSNNIDFSSLDQFIRDNIPYGYSINSHPSLYLSRNFKHQVEEICNKLNIDTNRALKSVGSLGGGNHFIELGISEGYYYLSIHSGSRNFGKMIAEYHQKKAKEETGLGELSYLNDSTEYLSDINFAVTFASQNRKTILYKIIQLLNIEIESMIDSIHNYIDLENKIIRKGATSAQKDELLVIPLNMRDGILICKGKGNPEWNYSAPHGAGRLYSRSKAKQELSLNTFKQAMEGIYTSCISEHTLDECPAAYKDAEEIVERISDTCTVEQLITPLYNFKA